MNRIVAPLPAEVGHVVNPASGKSIRCQILCDGRPSPPPRDLDDLSEILKEAGSFVWFDVVDPGPSDLALLQNEFDLHPLAVEDAVQAHQRPKIESYEDYWFIVVQGITAAPEGLSAHEIAIFAGKRYLVTVRHGPAYPLDEIERRWLVHPAGLRRDSGFLLYTILDTVVDGYFPVAEAFEDRVDALEARLFSDRPLHNDVNDVLVQIFAMKKDGQMFRRAALPMRDILNPIIRGDIPLFADEQIAYFRDVYDHAVRILDQIDATRDLVNSALEIHLSVVGNRQNEVSKQLTVMATIFLPLTFITGFFGQNFGVLVAHIVDARSFWVLGIGSELVALAVLLLYFKRRGWF